MQSDEFRKAGHELVDRLAAYFESIEQQPVFPDIEPDQLEASFDRPLPEDGRPLDDVLAELDEKLFPYCTHVGHPGYMGLITPSPTPVGVLADFIASALNQNVGGYSIGPGAVALERRTVRWLNDLVGFGPAAGGHLTSGGTMANFEGLKLARDAKSGDRAQFRGLREPWAVYASQERHVSVDKAVDAVGLGRDALRALPTNERLEVSLEALDEAVALDRRRGIRPLCVVGLAGTTNTGSVDNLLALREICDREGMWLHVDAAYGGGVLLSQAHRDILAGVELADSVTIDPHKWFYAPLDAGAILARDASAFTRSFGMRPSYLTDELDEEGARFQYYVHSFEQSRRFRGLKVWMAFQRYGRRELASWVDANIELAAHTARRVQAEDDFELAVAPRMSAICIRFCPQGVSDEILDSVHKEVAQDVERSGRFWMSTTVLGGRMHFRINPVNFRTRAQHMDALMDFLIERCRARTRAPQSS